MKNRKKRSATAISILLILLFGTPFWLAWREIRQERLNLRLIQSVIAADRTAITNALQQGANPDTRLIPDRKEVRFYDRLYQMFHPQERTHQSVMPTALMLAVQSEMQSKRTMIFLESDKQVTFTRYDAAEQSRYELEMREFETRSLQFDNFDDASDRSELTEQLLLAHANVNASDADGTTALMYAANYGHTRSAAMLLDRGADIQARDKDGRTALFHAVWRGNLKMVRLLLEHGANARDKDNNGITLLKEVDDWRGGEAANFEKDEHIPELKRLLKHCGAQ